MICVPGVPVLPELHAVPAGPIVIDMIVIDMIVLVIDMIVMGMIVLVILICVPGVPVLPELHAVPAGPATGRGQLLRLQEVPPHPERPGLRREDRQPTVRSDLDQDRSDPVSSGLTVCLWSVSSG